MRAEFRKRLQVMFLIILISCLLNTLLRHWIFSSIGHCLCGLLCLVRPIKMSDAHPEKRQLTECRIAGAVLILLGILLRQRLY